MNSFSSFWFRCIAVAFVIASVVSSFYFGTLYVEHSSVTRVQVNSNEAPDTSHSGQKDDLTTPTDTPATPTTTTATLLEYPSPTEVVSLDWYGSNFNNSRYRSLSMQKEVFWGRPKVHGRCSKLIFAVRGGGFQLMTMHGPNMSVEQKLVETIVSASARQARRSEAHQEEGGGRNNRRSSIAELFTLITPRGGRNNRRSSNGKGGGEGVPPRRIVMDLGVNDGEDISTWFEAFGTDAEDRIATTAKGGGGSTSTGATQFVLIEPQEVYRHKIHCAVEQHYFRQNLSNMPLRRVTPVGQQQQDGGGGNQSTSPLLPLSGEGQQAVVTAPCSNITAHEWGSVTGKRAQHGLVDATDIIFLAHERAKSPTFLKDHRVLYLKAAAATMPNQHLQRVLMSGSGEQAAVVMSKQPALPINAATTPAPLETADSSTVGLTTLVSLAELYRQLTIREGGGGADERNINSKNSPATQRSAATAARDKGLMIRSLAATPSRISLLKIDCEGADPSIVMGAWELFASQRVDILIIEVHKNNFLIEGAFPYNYTEAVAMLRFYGYRTFLIGFFHMYDSFVFLEVDAAFMALWKPNLETIVALPAVPQDGQPFFLYRAGVAKRLTKKVVMGFFIASSRMNVETSNYWGRVRNEGHFMSCLMGVYLVKCPVCGGERPLRSKKKYGG